MTKLFVLRFDLLLAVLCVLAGAAVAQAPSRAMTPVGAEVAVEFRAIGRINKAGFKGRSTCSGVLIEPDVVLTAGHCVRTGFQTGNPLMFVAGWDRGDYAAARPGSEELRHPVYGIGGRHDPRYDVGLLFLETPITEVAPIPMAPDANARVGVLGYHRATPHMLSGRLDCPVTDRTERILSIGCPVVSGNSGAPVLERNVDGDWRVTAVVSSTTGAGALATRIPQWVYDVLEDR